MSTSKFHQSLTFILTCFLPKMKVLGAQKMDFPTKSLKLQMGMAGPIIELSTPSKLGEFYISLSCKDAICYNMV